MGHYLGCLHEPGELNIKDVGLVRTMTYNMQDYLEAIVVDYSALAQDLPGKEFKLKEVATPFLEDNAYKAPARAQFADGPQISCPYCCFSFPIDMAKKETWTSFLNVQSKSPS